MPSELSCPYCGSTEVRRIQGLQGVEALICLALCFCLIIPGVIYYALTEAKPYCTGCGRRVRK